MDTPSADKNLKNLINPTSAYDEVIHTASKEATRIRQRLKRSYRQIKTENVFRRVLVLMGLIMVILVLGILLTLIVESVPSIKALGVGYLWGKTWDPVRDIYGAYPFLLGTSYILPRIDHFNSFFHCCGHLPG
jgi:hypothetical protein